MDHAANAKSTFQSSAIHHQKLIRTEIQNFTLAQLHPRRPLAWAESIPPLNGAKVTDYLATHNIEP